MGRVGFAIAASIRFDDGILAVALEPFSNGASHHSTSVGCHTRLNGAIQRLDHGLVQPGGHRNAHTVNLPWCVRNVHTMGGEGTRAASRAGHRYQPPAMKARGTEGTPGPLT